MLETKTNVPIFLLLVSCLFPKFLFEEDQALEGVAEDLFLFLVSRGDW